jgi:hypothetical protein
MQLFRMHEFEDSDYLQQSPPPFNVLTIIPRGVSIAFLRVAPHICEHVPPNLLLQLVSSSLGFPQASFCALLEFMPQSAA